MGVAIKIKVLSEGTGPQPELSTLIEFNYIGSLESGGTFADIKSAKATLGDGDVCPGLELGLRHMKVGATCLIKCVSRFAYGPSSFPPLSGGTVPVPPDSDVEFEVTLLNVKAMEKGPADMTAAEKVEFALFRKNIGNALFASHDYNKAARCYAQGLEIAQGAIQQEKEAAKEANNADIQTSSAASSVAVTCANNTAAAYIKLENYKKVLEVTDVALVLDPSNAKALYRKGQAHLRLREFKDAQTSLTKALEIDPTSKEVREELRALKTMKTEYNEKKKEMEHRMSKLLVPETVPPEVTLTAAVESIETVPTSISDPPPPTRKNVDYLMYAMSIAPVFLLLIWAWIVSKNGRN